MPGPRLADPSPDRMAPAPPPVPMARRVRNGFSKSWLRARSPSAHAPVHRVPAPWSSRWSARQAALAAVGSDQFIRNLRRGRVPAIGKFRALCEVLGLEFYVGPPRGAGTVDPDRLRTAIDTIDEMLRGKGFVLDPQPRSELVASVYDLIGESASPADTARVRRLIAAMIEGASSRK